MEESKVEFSTRRKSASLSQARPGVSNSSGGYWVSGTANGRFPLSGRGALWLGAVLAAILTLGSMVWGIPHVERELEQRTVDRLIAEGVDTAALDISYSWRDGEISGVLPRGTTAEEVASLVEAVDGVRKVSLDLGVTPAPAATTVPAPSAAVGPVSVIAQIAETGIRLSGTVLSDSHRDELVAAAGQSLGTDSVDDRLQVSGLEAEIDGADERVAALASVLSKIEPPTSGRIVLVDESLSSALVVPSESSRDAISEAFAATGLVGEQQIEVNAPIIDLSIEEEVVELQAELDALQAEIAQNVVFSPANATLTPAAKATLDKVADALLRYRKPVIDAEGHTDSFGDAEDNRRLSQARADSVLAYLAEVGVDEARLSAIGYGQDRPIGDNATSEGRQQNRRVQFLARSSF